MNVHPCWIVVTLALAPSLVFAHPGGLDSSGGHYNRKTGAYHFHGKAASDPGDAPRATYRSEPRTETPQVRTSARLMAPRHDAWADTSATEGGTSDKTDAEQAAELFEEAKIRMESAVAIMRTITQRYPDSEEAKLSVNLMGRLDKTADGERREIADERSEKHASGKLALAKQFRSEGRASVAERYLKEIIEEYPGTQAAQEASMLLPK